MIHVLITGKTGFIGNAVQNRLSDFPLFFTPSLQSIRDNAWRIVGFKGYNAIVHTAGIAHVQSDPSLEGEYMRVNRDLTLAIAKRAKADGVRHFIFMSSIIVYGDASCAGERKIITPDTVPCPSGAYGQSKLEAENGLLALADDHFKVSIIRSPMVYGRGCKGNYNTLSILARKLPVFPDFDNYRSAIYVGNLAELIRIILEKGLEGTFCPQDEFITSTRNMVERIARARGKKIRFLKCLNPLVRLAGKSGVVRRAFGDMAYAPEMSAFPDNYRIYDPDASIRNTEIQ